MEPVFELASVSAIETLMSLMGEFYAYEALPFDEQAARSALQLILTNDSYGCVYIIRIDEAIAGYLAITFGFSLEYGGRDAFLDEIYLRAAYRGRGIGTQSLQFAETICREQGIQALHLEAERKNIPAQAFYRNAGFVDHNRVLFTKWL
ncbi:MAG: GNAT family N-acetyltransferase [Cyanobacteria bacterium J06638_20]